MHYETVLFLWYRFACSLLRQGMKQICITTPVTDSVTTDVKQVPFVIEKG